jgi:DNA replication protein DnaC
MLTEPAIEKLRYLKMYGMADFFKQQMDDPAMKNLTFEERFELLVDAEYSKRRNTLLQRLTASSRLKISQACMEGIEYQPDRDLDRDLLMRLFTCSYIGERRNVIIMGATGAGKTYIGCALGNAACRKFLKVRYIRLPDLLTDLAIAKGNGTFRGLLNQYRKNSLLILDEWLLLPLDIADAHNVLEIVEARHEESSTIFISQSAPAGWHSMIGEGRVADAILDRILHNSYEILVKGISMREKQSFKKKRV